MNPNATSKLETLLSNISHINSRTLLFLILLMGLTLRIYAAVVGQGYHHTAMNDEVSAYQYMLAFINGESYSQYLAQPVFAGAQIPGPLWTLFWLTLYTLGGDSVSNAIILMAVFNTAAIYIVYRLGIYFIDEKYALFVAALYAISPWPIYYASGMWNPMPLPVLGGILILSLWKSYSLNYSKTIFFVPLLSALLLQFHAIVIFYMPVILFFILMARKRVYWKYFYLGVVAGLMLYIPYLIGEINNNWSNTQEFFSEKSEFSYGFIKVFSILPALISSTPGNLADNVGELKKYGDHFFFSYQIMIVLLLPSIIVSLSSYIIFVKKYIKITFSAIGNSDSMSSEAQKIIFLGTTIFVPITMLMLIGHNYTSRYALIVIPLLFLLPGIFLKHLGRYKQIFKAYFLFAFLLNIYISLSFYSYQNQTITQGTIFKPSFKKMALISEKIEANKRQGSLVKISLSPAVEAIKSHDYGKYKALIEFITLEQKYIYRDHSSGGQPSYFYIKASSETSDSKRSIIYRDGSIIIETINPKSKNSLN